jgi:hypothetical protein
MEIGEESNVADEDLDFENEEIHEARKLKLILKLVRFLKK